MASRVRQYGETLWIELCGRAVPAVTTPEGVRAVAEDIPIEPAAVERYLRGKFGEALGPVRQAMEELAASIRAGELGRRAFGLYEAFRPTVPEGVSGWGAKGVLDLRHVREAATREP